MRKPIQRKDYKAHASLKPFESRMVNYQGITTRTKLVGAECAAVFERDLAALASEKEISLHDMLGQWIKERYDEEVNAAQAAA